MKKTAEERYWEKVDKTDNCWLWTASCTTDGYGKFWNGGKLVVPHRLSYEWTHGDIPDGMQVDHRCHTRNCVRPDHLRLVTHAQNQQNRRGAQSNNATGVRGVGWHKPSRKYLARVALHGKTHYVGLYDTLAEAEAAVVAKRLQMYTHDDYADWATTTEEAPTPGDHVL